MCGNISKPRQISRLSGSCNADSAHDIHERRESSVGAVIPCPEAFIPTHVGRISMDARRLRRLCHSPPRMWGGCSCPGPEAWNSRHSPPRMWGGCIGVDHAAALVPRFIPTYVGRMITLRSSSRTHSGSSPRTWGGFHGPYHVLGRPPGSSPRTWGGCDVRGLQPCAISGSSPRTWGGCIPNRAPCHLVRRFIPTHVGRMVMRRNTP